MAWLRNIRYSHDECVSAMRDYYDFLTKMYADESAIMQPPEEGWPTITAENMQGLGKTDKVLLLLRHLPYLRCEDVQGPPYCYFADWQWAASKYGCSRDDKMCSESAELYEEVPSSVVSLTMGARDNPVFLLDTELGVVYWFECTSEMANCTKEQVLDDPYEYTAEDETDWRTACAAWSIADFEVLKNQFRQLHFVPISSHKVEDVYPLKDEEGYAMVAMVQDIYRRHGWPDLERYCKQACLEDIQSALRERFPDYAGL